MGSSGQLVLETKKTQMTKIWHSAIYSTAVITLAKTPLPIPAPPPDSSVPPITIIYLCTTSELLPI